MTEQEAKQAVSATLLAAQARLLSRRAQREAARVHPAAAPGRWQEPIPPPVSRDITPDCDRRSLAGLPDHLGWGSQRQAEQIRRALANNGRNKQTAVSANTAWLNELARDLPPTPGQTGGSPLEGRQPAESTAQKHTQALPTTAELATAAVKLHPSIGLGLLRKKTSAPGRIWLLLRWLDTNGAGWIDTGNARRLLCSPDSAVRVCSWRHLRTLLAKGEDLFWNHQGDRIWLRSIPKVARSLHMTRLAGHPVRLPVKILLQSIGQVRAHLYASFHSGRAHANPISRASLRKISQVSPRSQQNYEKKTRIKKQKNYAIGSKLTDDHVQNQGWLHGPACFAWRDHQASLGRTGHARLAWQLPNSYLGPHERQPRGRLRQINHQLAVLLNKGITGNGHVTDDCAPRRYFSEAARAVQTLNRTESGVYWQSEQRGRWYFLDLRARS